MQPFRFKFRLFTVLAITLLAVAGAGRAQKIWTLENCIDYALANNLDIRKQLLAVEANRRTVLQSGLAMLPNLNANGTNVWNFGQTIDLYTNTFANSTVRSNNFYVSSNMTLYSGLQKFNTLKENKINLLASQYDMDVLKNNISLSVAAYYLDMLFNLELLDAARDQMAITTAQADRVNKLVEAGGAARGDLLNIQAQKATEELNVVTAENRLYLSGISLQQLIDLPVTKDFVIEKPQLKEVQPPDAKLNAEVIFATALKARPEIRAAELRVEIAKKKLAVARGYIQPTLSVSGSWGTGYSGSSFQRDPNGKADTTLVPVGYTQNTHEAVLMPNIEYPTRIKPFSDQMKDNSNQSVGFYLNIPIFNGWGGRTAISMAKIQKAQAEIDLEGKTRDLRKTIEQSYADALAALQKYNASKDKVTAQKEAFNYAQQKFDVGVMTSFDYNNTKKDLTLAESQLLQAKYDFIFKVTILDFYMGYPIKIDRE
ncbi:MAG TPA: TolC family protein [Bacteroidales bacterium]|nr:TolC family protein [Bacteroidales bacterium]HPS61426.1 TolC family protein [Bacteroidales bacterium]